MNGSALMPGPVSWRVVRMGVLAGPTASGALTVFGKVVASNLITNHFSMSPAEKPYINDTLRQNHQVGRQGFAACKFLPTS